ncbi:putative quinol monooxygenase [Amycolatopsis sp. NPDC098790]|uniref:putative quinol monooxygenase n=1 Tax=Amycolatopsis sp. NPDC098790 TaxID=3363939 RepID=UPI003830DD68
MSFVVVVKYRVETGAEAEVAALLGRMVEPTRAEAGNLRYDVYRAPGDPALFVLVEEYRDETAFQAHLDSVHFGQYLRAGVLPKLAGRERFDLVPL